MRFTSLIFDFDGTLVNSRELYIQGYVDTLRALGKHLSKRNIESKLVPSIPDMFSKFLKTREDIDRGIDLLNTILLRNNDVQPCDGVPEILRVLYDKSTIKLGLLTNSYRPFLKKVLSRIDADNYFHKIVTAEEGSGSKKERCSELINSLGSNKKKTLYIGDTPHDVEVARYASCMVAIVFNPCSWAWPQRETVKRSNPDYLISSLTELPSLLEM